MTAPHVSTQNANFSQLGAIQQSLVWVLFFEILSFGFYGILRFYRIHHFLSKHKNQQIFAQAFIHILVMMRVALIILLISRQGALMDTTLLLAAFGYSLLHGSLLLVLRKFLWQEFQLKTAVLPLLLFQVFYLQFRINRHTPSNAFIKNSSRSNLRSL